MTVPIKPKRLVDSDSKTIASVVDTITNVHTAEPVSKEVVHKSGLKRVPFFSDFLERMNKAGWSLSGLSSSHGTMAGFDIASVVLSGLNFVKLPLAYGAAYLAGQKLPPLTPSKGAKWLLSGAGVGLGLGMLLAPAALPIIATVGGAVAAVTSGVGFVKTLRERAKLTKELESVRVDIKVMRSMQDSAIALKAKYDALQVQSDSLDDSKNANKALKLTYQRDMAEIASQLQGLSSKFNALKPQELLNKEARCVAGLKTLQPSTIVNKGAGAVLATVGLVGAITLFFAPPVGFGLLAAAAVGAGALLVARAARPLFNRLKNWFTGKPSKSESSKGQEMQDVATLDSATPNCSPALRGLSSPEDKVAFRTGGSSQQEEVTRGHVSVSNPSIQGEDEVLSVDEGYSEENASYALFNPMQTPTCAPSPK